MSCACTYGFRFVFKHTVCLDILYETVLRKKITRKQGDLIDDEAHVGSFSDGQVLIVKPEMEKKRNPYVYTYICFFLAGIALNLCWGSISFLAPYWIHYYGAGIWKDLVVCYNFPGFPILLFQLLTDERTARWLGTRMTYMIRLVVSFLLVAVLCGLVPYSQYVMASQTYMLIFVTIVGTAVGLGHGWIYSIVSLYPPNSVSYLVAGGGMSTVILLVLTIAEEVPTEATIGELAYYFGPACLLSIIGIFFIVSLLLTRESAEILRKVDYVGSVEKINVADEDEQKEKLLKDEDPAPFDKPGHIVKHIWSPLISIFFSIFSIVAAVTLIAVIPSATNNSKFPAYILYISSISGFVGNELAVYIKGLAKPWPLFIFSTVRLVVMPFLLIYSTTRFWLNDIFILTVIGVFSISGAFSVSKCYSLCSASVSLKQQASASNWLNISLYLGVYLALGFPYVLPYIVPATQ